MFSLFQFQEAGVSPRLSAAALSQSRETGCQRTGLVLWFYPLFLFASSEHLLPSSLKQISFLCFPSTQEHMVPKSHWVYAQASCTGKTPGVILCGSQLLIQEVGADTLAWARCQPLAQLSVGNGLHHVVQTWLPGATTIPIQIGK